MENKNIHGYNIMTFALYSKIFASAKFYIARNPAKKRLEKIPY
jgi:hypothetical protein